jgi:hypothetical protein
MYTRPKGKAYVKKGRSFGWVVLVWNGPDKYPSTLGWHGYLNWRDAVDSAIKFNETYYITPQTQTQTGEPPC